jgi:hypothetical protein
MLVASRAAAGSEWRRFKASNTNRYIIAVDRSNRSDRTYIPLTDDDDIEPLLAALHNVDVLIKTQTYCEVRLGRDTDGSIKGHENTPQQQRDAMAHSIRSE